MTNQLRSVTLLAACALLTACVSTTPNYDARLGDAVQISQARQTIDPGATARNASKDVAGVDGRAARAAFDRYLFSFIKPEPQANVFAIGVTGNQGTVSGSR